MPFYTKQEKLAIKMQYAKMLQKVVNKEHDGLTTHTFATHSHICEKCGKSFTHRHFIDQPHTNVLCTYCYSR